MPLNPLHTNLSSYQIPISSKSDRPPCICCMEFIEDGKNALVCPVSTHSCPDCLPAHALAPPGAREKRGLRKAVVLPNGATI